MTVENRSDFVDLNEFTFNWTLAGKTGVEKSAGAPGAKGKLAIPVTGDVAGKSLEIRITGPRGFMVDAYRFTIGGEKIEMPSPVRAPTPLELKQDAQTITIIGKDFHYTLDAATGQLRTGRG